MGIPKGISFQHYYLKCLTVMFLSLSLDLDTVVIISVINFRYDVTVIELMKWLLDLSD